MSRPIFDPAKGAILDLDGVVYVGSSPVPGAASAIADWTAHEVPFFCATNNAAHSASQVAQRLQSVGVDAPATRVLTSAQATAQAMRSELPVGSRVLVVGSYTLEALLASHGFHTVHASDFTLGTPVDAVVQGFDRSVDWHWLRAGIAAVRQGAAHWATNPDLQVPTADGLFPGNGTFVNLVSSFTGVTPTVIGKPKGTMLTIAASRMGTTNPVMVGDQLVTDIAAAHEAGFPSALVLTGVNDVHDALRAPQHLRPDAVIGHLGELFEDTPAVSIDGDTAHCGDDSAQLRGSRVSVSSAGRCAVQAALALTGTAIDAGIDGRTLDLTDVPRRFDERS